MELFEDPSPAADQPGGNAPALSVSELSGAVKRVIEGEFGRVRVRGEVGRVARPRSGHVYFDLKDDSAVISAICWRGQAAKLATQPEEGMEIIATGRLTTYPGQSRYQIIIESIEPAGLGALMAMLEKRRAALMAEGLFEAGRKLPLPVLPRVIGVVTSPSGAVIRDILHRLRDRFPVHVLIWPVAVQGQASGAEVAAAIRGFNALPETGQIPRPDLLIVARGGGSIEDLWGFNDEAVVRAAAASTIPLISAVGHETDTTLIDHAADMRAPTPTAAAEIAVPVRADLITRLADIGARQVRTVSQRLTLDRQRLRDLARTLGRPQSLTEGPRQRLDLTGPRLGPALRGLVSRRRAELAGQTLRPSVLNARLRMARQGLMHISQTLPATHNRRMQDRQRRLADGAARMQTAIQGRASAARQRNAEARRSLQALQTRLHPAMTRHFQTLRENLARMDRLRQTLGYRETLRRGFVVIRGPDGLLKTAAAAAQTRQWQVEFSDDTLMAAPVAAAPDPKPRKKPASGPLDDQGNLF